MLLHGVDVNKPSRDPNGYVNLVRCGDDNDDPGRHQGGLTALQGAAAGGHATVLKTLLSAGADVNAPARSCVGMTALQAACAGGYQAIFETLLMHGADIHAAVSECTEYQCESEMKDDDYGFNAADPLYVGGRQHYRRRPGLDIRASSRR